MDLNAINTQYKNHYFRSRLEAKWAIFFDELNIDWEYEPESYILDNGVVYCPDFYLPMFGLYVEIKHDYNPFESIGEYNPTYYEKLTEHQDYKPKWKPFSFYNKLIVFFGEPKNIDVYVLWENGGNVNLINGEYWMGYSIDISSGELYLKYKDSFNPKIAHFFIPFKETNIFINHHEYIVKRAIKKALSYRFH